MAEEKKKRAGLFQYLGYWGYKLFCGVLRCIDVRIVAAFGRAVGYLVWAASPERRRIVARNLRIVVNPSLRADKLNSMVRRNMVRTTMNLLCSIKTGLLTDAEEARAIRTEGEEIFAAHGMNGNCAIACLPHAGNWEVFARIRPHFAEVEHFGSMYRQLSNPLLEKLVYESRTRFGCEMYSKKEGLRSVLKLAHTGGLLGILSDQFTQEGLFIPYFGKVTGVTPLPALLFRRCKGKGHLFSVISRNTALGRWDAVVGRKIELPEGCEDMADITMQVNLAIEECQKENILDGFWMHHRWKCTRKFAPACSPEEAAVIARYAKLPFRIIVCVPESFEEALLTIPMMRRLKSCRGDMQLTVLCPQAQADFWRTQDYVTYTDTTDGDVPLLRQLDEEEQYKDGPYDIAFLLGSNAKVYKALRSLRPLMFTGFDDNPLFRRHPLHRRDTKIPAVHCAAPRHRAADYLFMLQRGHRIETEGIPYADETAGNDAAAGTFIAPFSSLSSTDTWAESKWAQLLTMLPGKVTLLALEQDRAAAKAMAERLGTDLLCCAPHEVAQHLGRRCRLYAVDGLLPQLAALANCPCTVIMANRLAERYAPLGNGHRAVFDHKPDYPCYGKACDKRTDATAAITPEDVLG